MAIVNRLVYGDPKPFKVHEGVRITVGKDPNSVMLRLMAQAATKYKR